MDGLLIMKEEMIIYLTVSLAVPLQKLRLNHWFLSLYFKCYNMQHFVPREFKVCRLSLSYSNAIIWQQIKVESVGRVEHICNFQLL